MPLPLIIGQAPARGNDGLLPFAGKSGARLARVAGVGDTGDVLKNYFDLRNLLSFYPGKRGRKGDEFDLTQAKDAADQMKTWLLTRKGRVILLMGKEVAKAFGCPCQEYFRPWYWHQHTVIIFPHPSGVNQWWNDAANVKEAEGYLRELIRAQSQ